MASVRPRPLRNVRSGLLITIVLNILILRKHKFTLYVGLLIAHLRRPSQRILLHWPKQPHQVLHIQVLDLAAIAHNALDFAGLALLHLQEQLCVDGVVDHEAAYFDGRFLTNAEDTAEGLVFGAFVPPGVDDDAFGSMNLLALDD